MSGIIVRKKLISVEDIFHEGGPVSNKPLKRAVAAAVVHNPFAGRYVEEITHFMDDLKPLGLKMADELIKALGGDAAIVEGYGKAAIVGEAGELGTWRSLACTWWLFHA